MVIDDSKLGYDQSDPTEYVGKPSAYHRKLAEAMTEALTRRVQNNLFVTPGHRDEALKAIAAVLAAEGVVDPEEPVAGIKRPYMVDTGYASTFSAAATFARRVASGRYWEQVKYANEQEAEVERLAAHVDGLESQVAALAAAPSAEQVREAETDIATLVLIISHADAHAWDNGNTAEPGGIIDEGTVLTERAVQDVVDRSQHRLAALTNKGATHAKVD